MKIINTSNRRALDRVLSHDTRTDPQFDRRVAAIVDGVRKGGDRALLAFARRFDGVSGPIEVTRDEIIDGAAQTPAAVRRAIREAVRNIRRVAARRSPQIRFHSSPSFSTCLRRFCSSSDRASGSSFSLRQPCWR